nr:zinc ribbon domain-containing protein [Lactiplantibacillus plantarum]
MKKCPNCGTEIAANAKFCTHCGYDLTKATPASATANATSATATQTTTATTQAAVHTSTASANQQQSASAEKQTASRSAALIRHGRLLTNKSNSCNHLLRIILVGSWLAGKILAVKSELKVILVTFPLSLKHYS